MQFLGVIDLNKINKYNIVINKDVSVFKFIIGNDNEKHGDYNCYIQQDNTIIGGCNTIDGELDQCTIIEMYVNPNMITDVFLKNNVMAFYADNKIVYHANFIKDYKKSMIKVGAYKESIIERKISKIKNPNLPFSYFD